jgi:hypothetical protein
LGLVREGWGGVCFQDYMVWSGGVVWIRSVEWSGGVKWEWWSGVVEWHGVEGECQFQSFGGVASSSYRCDYARDCEAATRAAPWLRSIWIRILRR